MTISRFLNSLPPSGTESFEELVGELLTAVTGQRFRSARSGDQQGRDGRASAEEGGAIAFECKRYGEDSPIRDRDIAGGLQQAHESLPNLDVWILAASRRITDQNLTALEGGSREHGIDILPLESLDDGGGDLDILCATHAHVVERFATPEQFAALQPVMEDIARSALAGTRLEAIRKQLLRPSCGWPAWRMRSHEEWLQTVDRDQTSRSRLGQPMNVTSENTIPRASADKALDDWWQSGKNSIFAMTGEEGDGKSWAVAQWLTKKAQNSDDSIPPVVFVPSRDAGDEKDLEDLVIASVERLFPSGEWKQKLERWLEYQSPKGDRPVVLVVLDGLNERHSPGYWRNLLESSFAPPWDGRVRIICTVRKRYWNEHFNRPSTPASVFSLSGFNDQELDLALKKKALKPSDFPEEISPLLRKPRYFDLATKYRGQMSEAGDFTLARLYFEDWRDRCDRKTRPLSESEFNTLLRQIAERYREDVKTHTKKDIQDFIGTDSDSAGAFQELTTGGVLEQRGARWTVDAARLPVGLGLLLSDELQNALTADQDLKETIASWLEPYTNSDLEALIVEYALLASISQEADRKIISSLLLAWINTQNPRSRAGSPIERHLCAYMPQCLDSYVDVAESVWNSKGDHPWAQEVLLGGFVQWSQTSASFAERLTPTLLRWLSMVPLDGPPMLRRENRRLPQAKNQNAANDDATKSPTEGRVKEIWPDAVPNRVVSLYGYSLTLIENDGWLRLSHAAFVIISCLRDRVRFVDAFAAFCVAKGIHESGDGYREMQWSVRSSETDLEPAFEGHIQRLLNEKSRPAQMALSRMLRYIGTASAWATLAKVDEDSLFPPSNLAIEARKNPVESIFRCTKQELEEYALRQDFKPWAFIDSAQSYIADPDLNLPSTLSQQFEPVVEELEARPVWQGMWKSGEDHWLEKAIPVLARVLPSGIAKVLRRIVEDAATRSADALYALAAQVSVFDLVLDEKARLVLQSIRENRPGLRTAGDGFGPQTEFRLFARVLGLWNGTEQLEHLVARPEDAFDWLNFELFYRGPVDHPLPCVTTSKSWFRVLYFLSVVGDAKLDGQTLSTIRQSEDTLVRGALFRYMFFCDLPSSQIRPLLADWSWSPEMQAMEQSFGSLLLMKVMTEEQAANGWMRVDPTFRATALLRAAGSETDWDDYALWFSAMVLKLRAPISTEGLPAYEIAYSGQGTGRPRPVSLAPERRKSIRFIAPETHWGGRRSEGPFSDLIETPEAVRERHKRQIKELQEKEFEAVSLGNYWLQRCFPLDAIEAMLDRAPEIINRSIRAVLDLATPRVPVSEFSYYSALTEVLFSKTERIQDAFALYRVLQRSSSGVRIRDRETGLNQLDLVLFAAPETEETRELWDEAYRGCTTDRDLLDLALMVRRSRRGNSAEWLERIIAEGLQSKSPYMSARASAIRGFLEPDTDAGWLAADIDRDSPWMLSVIGTAKDRVAAERHARYWFRLFCATTDMDEAWGAFRLFLSVVDRRCWIWLTEEMAVLSDDDPRNAFIEDNRDEIGRACKENEEKMGKSFLDCEIVEEMYPWKN